MVSVEVRLQKRCQEWEETQAEEQRESINCKPVSGGRTDERIDGEVCNRDYISSVLTRHNHARLLQGREVPIYQIATSC